MAERVFIKKSMQEQSFMIKCPWQHTLCAKQMICGESRIKQKKTKKQASRKDRKENDMKRISLDEICSHYKIHNYKELYEKVLSLIQNDKIIPLKASGKNGKKPALFCEYWVVEEQEVDSDYVEELSYLFVPMISTDYYLNHKKQYKEDREWLLLLNQYLKTSRNSLQIPKSMNERSFEIWHREKFLKEEQGKKILKRCGLSFDDLNLYETTEPLAYYTQTRKTPQNLLILENKDTFYSMRRRLLEGKERILGTSFGTLIYGAGKGIFRSFQDFSLCAEPYMREKDNVIYYFGDLDYEGIAIYEGLATLFQKECSIEPFRAGYIKMLEKAEQIEEELPKMKAGQNQNIGSLFFNSFLPKQTDKMLKLLRDGRYIPQEILSIEDF